MTQGTMNSKRMKQWLTHLGAITANPWSFVIVAVYAVCWFFLERQTFNLHAVATLLTLLITLLIQRTEYRDTQAIHAKLDELLHALPKARQELAQIDRELYT